MEGLDLGAFAAASGADFHTVPFAHAFPPDNGWEQGMFSNFTLGKDYLPWGKAGDVISFIMLGEGRMARCTPDGGPFTLPRGAAGGGTLPVFEVSRAAHAASDDDAPSEAPAIASAKRGTKPGSYRPGFLTLNNGEWECLACGAQLRRTDNHVGSAKCNKRKASRELQREHHAASAGGGACGGGSGGKRTRTPGAQGKAAKVRRRALCAPARAPPPARCTCARAGQLRARRAVWCAAAGDATPRKGF
jgi:hypothetical protein